MTINSLKSAVTAENVPVEQLAGNKTLSEKQKLDEASRQFEAVMLRQILGQGRKAVFRSKFNQESMTSEIYRDMITNQLADGISRGGGLGLARSLEAQLSHQSSATDAKEKP